MVTSVPPSVEPELGLMPVIEGGGTTKVNLSLLLVALVWPATVAVTSAMPKPPGLVAVQVVALAQETFVAATAPNLIVVADLLKFVPVMVTTVPPTLEPEVGLMLVTVGGACTRQDTPKTPFAGHVFGNTLKRPHMPA